MSLFRGNRVLWPLLLGLSLAACAERELILPGERFDTRAPLVASEPVDGQPAPVDTTATRENRAAPISLPPATANADWTHRGGNAGHRPPHGALASAPSLVWSANIGSGNARRNRITAAPVVAGGRVYAMDAVARVTAVSTAGAVLWSTDLTPVFDGSALSGGGLALGGGRLFATTGFGELVALDPAGGGVLWRQRLDSTITGAPSVEGNTVYAVGRDGAAWAVQADSGKVLWTLSGTPSVSGVAGSAGPSVDGNLVLFPFAAGQVIAAEKATGAGLWAVAVAGERRGRAYANITDITGEPVIAGSTAYTANPTGRTVAVNLQNGQRLWTAREGAVGPVLPVGNALFLITDEARLVRLDAATGEAVWSVEMPYYVSTRRENRRTGITAHYGPVLAGGRLVVASGDGALRFFNPVDGASLGQVALPGGAAGMPALAGGALYVPNQNGQLLAFR